MEISIRQILAESENERESELKLEIIVIPNLFRNLIELI